MSKELYVIKVASGMLASLEVYSKKTVQKELAKKGVSIIGDANYSNVQISALEITAQYKNGKKQVFHSWTALELVDKT